MGLTGIILSAKIKLKNIESAYIRQESIKAENLDDAMAMQTWLKLCFLQRN